MQGICLLFYSAVSGYRICGHLPFVTDPMVTGPFGTGRCLRVQSPLDQTAGTDAHLSHCSSLRFQLSLNFTLHSALCTLSLYALHFPDPHFSCPLPLTSCPSILPYIQNDKLSDKSLQKSGQSLQTSDVSFDNTD